MIVFRITWVWFDCRIIAFDPDLMSVLKTGAVFLVVDEIGVLCCISWILRLNPLGYWVSVVFSYSSSVTIGTLTELECRMKDNNRWSLRKSTIQSCPSVNSNSLDILCDFVVVIIRWFSNAVIWALLITCSLHLLAFFGIFFRKSYVSVLIFVFSMMQFHRA